MRPLRHPAFAPAAAPRRSVVATPLRALGLAAGLAGAGGPAGAAERVIFEDDFNGPASYHEAVTRNATHKEYTGRSLEAGHLLRKWRYSWDYSYEGDWQQAFYVVPPGGDAMVQAGRSACGPTGGFRIVADAAIPETATAYRIRFRQFKYDNDPVFYVLGADAAGWSETRLGFENQVPGTDETRPDMYVRGTVAPGLVRRGLAHPRKWVDVEIAVDVVARMVTWTVAGETVLEAHAPALTPGGYFGLYVCWERGTMFDDFRITVTE